jgi:hypothetical protein
MPLLVHRYLLHGISNTKVGRHDYVSRHMFRHETIAQLTSVDYQFWFKLIQDMYLAAVGLKDVHWKASLLPLVANIFHPTAAWSREVQSGSAPT